MSDVNIKVYYYWNFNNDHIAACHCCGPDNFERNATETMFDVESFTLVGNKAWS